MCDYINSLVFAVEQADPACEWLAARTEGLVNHLQNCHWQPPEVHQKAQQQKDNTRSPRKSVSHRNAGDGAEASSSFQGHSISLYPWPPVLHVQTLNNVYQSMYTLAVPELSTYTSYEWEPSIASGSTSGSSLAPSDSISVHQHPPSSKSRYSRSHVASFYLRHCLPRWHGQMCIRCALMCSWVVWMNNQTNKL